MLTAAQPSAHVCTPQDQTQRLTALAERVARLNPGSATIGAGMLASLVADAKAALGIAAGGAA